MTLRASATGILVLVVAACHRPSSVPPAAADDTWRKLAVEQVAQIQKLEAENRALRASCRETTEPAIHEQEEVRPFQVRQSRPVDTTSPQESLPPAAEAYAPPPPVQESAVAARDAFFSSRGPRIGYILPDSVGIDGEVRNLSRTPVSGTATLRLTRDGEYFAETQIYLDLAAGARHRYQHVFRNDERPGAFEVEIVFQ